MKIVSVAISHFPSGTQGLVLFSSLRSDDLGKWFWSVLKGLFLGTALPVPFVLLLVWGETGMVGKCTLKLLTTITVFSHGLSGS